MAAPTNLSLTTKLTGVFGGGSFGYAFADGSNGAGKGPFFVAHTVVNLAQQIINPATEDTLAAIVEALAGVLIAQAAPFVISQTIKALAAGTTFQLPANAKRKSLRWMVLGTGAVTVVPGDPPPEGAGMVYDGAPSLGAQGAAETFEGSGVPTNAFGFVANADTVLVIWEAA